MNPSRTWVEANPHSDVGWTEFILGWWKCGFVVSDCIHACACASAVHSKEMMGIQQRGYSLAFGVQPMCRASLRSFEDFTKVSLSPHVLPMYIRRSFGSLWQIVSAMVNNSGGSSSNAILQEWQAHGVNKWTMNCHELAKPRSTVSYCTYVQTQTTQFYPGSIRNCVQPGSTRFVVRTRLKESSLL